MFHYRLAVLNNRSRMFIAVFLAIALHMGLMNFEYEPESLSIPKVSLPRSVSVFLNQKNMVKAPVLQTEKAQIAEHIVEEKLSTEIEPEKPVTEKISPIKEKMDTPVQQTTLMEKTAKQPAAEEIVPASQKPEDIAEDIKPKPGEAKKIQELATLAEPQAVKEKEGVILPGTLQMAYPRYQLNTPPTYPGLARKRGQEGTVILQVLVNREGRVDDLKIDTSSNLTLLDRAAVTAVRKWSFEPGRRGEEKVPMWVRVPVTFKLKK